MLIVNPFSPEAGRIVKRHQAEGLPAGPVFRHAKKLVAWKAGDGKKRIIPPNLKSGFDGETDVLAWRLLFLTVALNFTPYSNELRLVKESIRDLTRARISALDLRNEPQIIDLLSDQFNIKTGHPTVDGGMKFGEVFVEKKEIFSGNYSRYGEPWRIKYAVSWRELIRIIRARELVFTDLYLVEGLALLSLKDLIDLYSRLIALKTEDFMSSRFEEFQGKRKSGEVKKLLQETSVLGDFLSEVAGKSYRASTLLGSAARLKADNFPPCIKGIIAGVESGSRNYAISVLLTSFLSFARVAPKKIQEPRLRDYVKDPKVLTDEILPLIYEAAARCQPPLFEDQPMEKMNVHYHLGLGLTSEVRLENSGRSPWYFPPNCEKIRRESPGLCRPDETCRQIKNPLTYYFVKFKKEEIRGGGSEEIDNEAPAEIKPKTKPKESGILSGKITKLQDGSGLIERCPKCNRFILDNICVVHGDVEGVRDLRVKAIFETSDERLPILFDKETTLKVLGMTFKEANKMSKDSVLNIIKKNFVGKEFELKGVRLERNFLVKEIGGVEDERGGSL